MSFFSLLVQKHNRQKNLAFADFKPIKKIDYFYIMSLTVNIITINIYVEGKTAYSLIHFLC